MSLRAALTRLRRAQDGVTAVETAFILPVLLFGLMMLFELAHMALVIAVGNVGLEHAVQRLRATPDYYRLAPAVLEQQVRERMSERSFGLILPTEIRVDILPFDNLRHYGESRGGAGGSGGVNNPNLPGGGAEEREANLDPVFSPPILSITADLQQDYMTTFPGLFGLGNGYQYQYRHLLGNLPASLQGEGTP